MTITNLQETAHIPAERGPANYPPAARAVLDLAFSSPARAEIHAWPDYTPTPLRHLDELAAELGVAQILYKDEASRFGLGSFKALGGAYEVLFAVTEAVSTSLGTEVTMSDLRAGRHRDAAAAVSVVTATDGNHGRAVAWGAQQAGCTCRIYVHAQVSPARIDAIAAYGAEVIQVDGNYDESVRAAAADAERSGATIVSDTAYPGYVKLPRQAMAGYTIMVQEIVDALTGQPPPSHVFVQAGCGGLAAAVCSVLWETYADQRPRFVLVEPTKAPCLFASAEAGARVDFDITEESIMAGLSCGEVSLLAWEILEPGVDDYLAIPDSLIAPAMRRLAAGVDGQPIVAGESAVAGLAALTDICERRELAEALGIDGASRVLLFGTEGATDPTIYREVVGADPASVA